MQRASDKRTVSPVTSSQTPSGRPVRALNRRRAPASSPAAAPVTEVHVSPTGTFSRNAPVEPNTCEERGRKLAITIRQRIESRLPGRVRELHVSVRENSVVLEGRCATYYTKQLAQHAALGVLDDELLENLIVVGVTQ
jgi:hypothetical protein